MLALPEWNGLPERIRFAELLSYGKRFRLGDPELGRSVARHAPIAAGGEADRADFRAVG